MFFLVPIETKIIIEPCNLNSRIDSYVYEKLIKKFEFKLHKKYGYIIKIKEIERITYPKVANEGSGMIRVKFKALVFRPIKGEVVDGVVSIINKIAVYSKLGPVDAGVSRRCMPSTMKFNFDSYENHFVDKESSAVIMKGELLRFRIISVRIAENKFEVMGVINNDFLGPL